MKTFFRIFWNSTRGFQSYQEIFRNPLRTTFLYWFALCVLFGCLAGVVNSHRFLTRTLPDYAAEVSKNLPEFSFRNGKLETSLPTPFFHNTNSTARVPIVLDPDGKIDRLPEGFTNGLLHIGRTHIRFWAGPEGKSTLVPIQGFPNGKVDRDYLMKFGGIMGYLMAPILAVILTLVFFLVGLLQAFFFASLVSFLERAMRPGFTFEELLNISIYALTPSSLIVLVYWLWGLHGLPFDLIFFLTYIVFHVMGSGACRKLYRRPDDEDLAD